MSKKLITEFVGTFLLVFAIVTGGSGPLGAIGIGATLMAAVYMGGPISGAHYNPAVTLAIWLRKHMNLGEALAYMSVQVIAALGAATIGNLILGHPASINPSPTTSTLAAILVEMIFTMALVLVVLNVAISKRSPGNQYYGLAIGITIMGAAIAGGGLSGGAYNPAVGLGISAVDSFITATPLTSLWIYLVGPFAGSLVATLIFKMQEDGFDDE